MATKIRYLAGKALMHRQETCFLDATSRLVSQRGRLEVLHWLQGRPQLGGLIVVALTSS
jgi:hypothetical protein